MAYYPQSYLSAVLYNPQSNSSKMGPFFERVGLTRSDVLGYSTCFFFTGLLSPHPTELTQHKPGRNASRPADQNNKIII